MYEAMEDVESIDPYEGFAYREQTMVVESAEHNRMLDVCGIDPALYGGKVDPAFFIGLAIHAGVNSGISANGSVNMVQSLTQHCPVALDEKLAVTGRVLKVVAAPRGNVVTSEVQFAGADGRTAITARRSSLRPDPAKAGMRGAGEKAAPVVEDVTRLRDLGDVQMTPDRVTGYRSTGNSIHFDPEAAKRGGFRAPIIGGGMGVHYLNAAIWRRFRPQSVDLEIYFRRPIFWDDDLSIRADEDGDTWTALCLAKGEKVATEARVNAISGG